MLDLLHPICLPLNGVYIYTRWLYGETVSVVVYGRGVMELWTSWLQWWKQEVVMVAFCYRVLKEEDELNLES